MYCISLTVAGKQSYALKKLLNWKDKMATHTSMLFPGASWIGTYWLYDIRFMYCIWLIVAGKQSCALKNLYCPHPVNVLPASMGYKMIANQMAGLLGHPVNVLPASMGYNMMYHGSELICILSNGTSMFQVPVATQMYARKRRLLLSAGTPVAG